MLQTEPSTAPIRTTPIRTLNTNGGPPESGPFRPFSLTPKHWPNEHPETEKLPSDLTRRDLLASCLPGAPSRRSFRQLSRSRQSPGDPAVPRVTCHVAPSESPCARGEARTVTGEARTVTGEARTVTGEARTVTGGLDGYQRGESQFQSGARDLRPRAAASYRGSERPQLGGGGCADGRCAVLPGRHDVTGTYFPDAVARRP